MAHSLLNTNIKKCHPERGEGSKKDSSLFELRMTGAAIIFLVLLLLGLACGEKPATKPSGGTLKLGAPGGKPSILNPVLIDRTVSYALMQLIYNSLVKLNPDMTLKPDLAESWEVSEDGLTYTFHLRKGVKFHDGVELTSEDVGFTYDLMQNKKINAPRRAFFNGVKKWEAPDKYTFKVTLRKPFG